MNKGESGVFLGIHPKEKLPLISSDEKNVLLVAPTRSGKGVNTVIPTGIIWKGSMFFFDRLGERWANTAGYRKKYLHQKVLCFYPLCKDGSAASWNPLAEVRFQTKEEWTDVKEMAHLLLAAQDEICKDSEDAKKHAETLLAMIMVYLLHKHYEAGRSIPTLFDVSEVLQGENIGGIFKEMKNANGIEELQKLIEANESEKQAVLSIANKALEVYRNVDVQKNMNHSDFMLRDLLNEKQNVSLYFLLDVYPEGIPIANFFVSMLMREAIIEMAKTSMVKREPHLLMMLDDTDLLHPLPYLEEFLAVDAKAGVKVCMTAMNVPLLEKLYGKDATIFSNFEVQLYFTPCLEDGGSTKQRIATMMGKDVKTFDAEKQIPYEEGIIFWREGSPVRVQKFRYYYDRKFKSATMTGVPEMSDTGTSMYAFA